MNIFKKLSDLFRSFFSRKEEEEQEECWFNNMSNSYDPKTGTPNGEAYISPNSIEIAISKSNQG